MFCVECGREGEIIESLCSECFAKKHLRVSIPDHVDLVMCSHCSSVLAKKGWTDISSVREAAELVFGESLSLSKGVRLVESSLQLSEKDERNLEARVRLLVSLEGKEFEKQLTTVLRIKYGSCKECSKQHGNYYEAILQVRGPERSLDDRTARTVEKLVKDRVASMRKGSREVFVSRIEEVRGGLDFYFSTTSAARSVARELQDSMCAEYKESSSLWGRRDGKEIYRVTFMIRFQGFAKGDVVEHGGRAVYVRAMSKGQVRTVDLVTGEVRSVRLKEPGTCSLLRHSRDIQKAVVLMESERELQVLDPETMKPMDLPKPPGFRRNGEHVRLAKTKLGTFVLSDSW